MVLYGPRGRRWALTERGRGAVARTATTFTIGPSAVAWEGDALVFRIDETTVPLPSRLRGVVRVHPHAFTGHEVALDAAGRHRWRPLAPLATVEAEFDRPAWRWQGTGYLDSNSGDAPLERDFHAWHWSRAARSDGAVLCYDAARRDGSLLSVALRCDRAGRIEPIASPPSVALPTTGWRIRRALRSDVIVPDAVRTLEDTPFYARSRVRQHVLGEAADAMHESLSLDRFAARWVQALLPFRMPRRPG